jgi:hypothetical protein
MRVREALCYSSNGYASTCSIITTHPCKILGRVVICYRNQFANHNVNSGFKELHTCFERWETMQKIFISYSRKDIDFARKLAGDLESAGYDVWWDITDLRGGDDWVSTLPQAISSSQYVIVVLTPASIESEWVRKEYTQALSLRKRIIPIMLESCSVPFALNTINFINFTGEEYADYFNKLLSALGYTGEPPVVTPYRKSIFPLPPAFMKYGIPGIIGLILILVFAWTSPFTPPATPTTTPTLTLTATSTSSSTPTSTGTSTSTATPTITPSLTPTDVTTASPTRTPQGIRLQICITAESGNIYVRSGPGQTYHSKILDVMDEAGEVVCPWFSARIENEGYFWLLLAPGQIETLREYEGGWIRRDLLDRESTVDILPAVTLTPTSTASSTSTITPSPTATNTSTPTATITDSPTETATP